MNWIDACISLRRVKRLKQTYKKYCGWPHSTIDSILASHPAAPGSVLGVPKNLSLLMLLRFIDSTAWNSGQRLYQVNRTHLVLASGKVVPQKTYKMYHLAFFHKTTTLRNCPRWVPLAPRLTITLYFLNYWKLWLSQESMRIFFDVRIGGKKTSADSSPIKQSRSFN